VSAPLPSSSLTDEEVRDLLSDTPKKKMDVKEDPEKGVFIKDLSYPEVTSVAQIEALMNQGNKNRSVGATAMNATSSRSHSLFTVRIETSAAVQGGEEQHIKAGKLNLVDLAGSERQSKTEAVGERLKEAQKINLSLSALGNVISALVVASQKGKGDVHIPYRDSKLTRLLQDSLGGNTKTIMIAALSPAEDNYDETLSTLRYANRAKNIKNKVHRACEGKRRHAHARRAVVRVLHSSISLLVCSFLTRSRPYSPR
jgi:hypothetical protein